MPRWVGEITFKTKNKMNEPITITEEVRETVKLWKLHLRVWDEAHELCYRTPEAQCILNASYKALEKCVRDMEFILKSHEVSK